MLDFIVKYWLQVLFGIITAGLSALCRHFYVKFKAERKQKETDFQAALRKDIADAIAVEHQKITSSIAAEVQKLGEKDSVFEDQISTLNQSMKDIKTGLLSVQGTTFKEQCRELLKTEHEITLAEFEQISLDHSAYNGLGGNHDGDQLFALVEIKYKNSITGN